MYLQRETLRNLILLLPEEAELEIRQIRLGSDTQTYLGHVSRARALELVEAEETGGIGSLTRLRYLLAVPGVKIDLALKAKPHLERPGHGCTAQDSRTVYSGDGDLALNYSHDFLVCGSYAPAVRLLTGVERQAVALVRSKLLRNAMELGVGIS